MSTHTEALALLASLVNADGSLWGERALRFQFRDARTVLDPSAPPNTFILRSRGGSKTDDAAGMALAMTTTAMTPGSRAYLAAADRDQARLALDSVAGFVKRTPHLADRFTIESWRAVDLETNSIIEVLSADLSSSWGLRAEAIICDEIAWWPETPSARTFYDSLSTTAAKSGSAKLILISTPSAPSHWAHRLYEHARNDPMWSLLETKGPAPWLDKAKLAEQKRRLEPSMYARLFDPVQWTSGPDILTTPDALEHCVTLDGPLPPKEGRSYTISLDVGLVHDRCVVTVCHGETVPGQDREERLRVVMDRQQTWAGSKPNPVQLADVEAWIAEASMQYRPATLIFDPFQAAQLSQELRDRGLDVRQFNFTASSASKIAVTLHNLIRERLLAIPDDPDLIDELTAVRLRETSPGTFRLDHDATKHDDRAVSLAMAAWSIVDSAPDAIPVVAPWGLEQSSGWHSPAVGSDYMDRDTLDVGSSIAAGVSFDAGEPGFGRVRVLRVYRAGEPIR